MKKLLLSLVAVVMTAISAYAGPALYLRGDISSWGTSLKFTEDNGVYTLNLDKLSGQFKIADASWGSDNFGSNGSKVEVGVPYTTSKGSTTANMSLAGSGVAENVTLTFVYSTGVLTITGKSAENTYDKLYIIGQINTQGWEGDRTDMPLEKVNETTFKGTYNITTSSNYFKIQAGTWTYGPATDASGDISLNVGDKATLNYPAGDKAYTLPSGEYTFTVTLEKGAATGTLEISGKAVYPDQIYLLGDYKLNGTEVHWNPQNGILMNGNNGVYTENVEFVYGTDMAPAAYFSFCTQLGTWETGVGTRYGAAEKDTQIALNGSAALVAGENSFAITPGAYSVTVDLVNMKVSIGETTGVGEIAEENGVADVYTVAGVLVRKGVNAAEATAELPAGLYIVGGKKVLVTK